MLRRALAEKASELPVDATAKLLAVGYQPRGVMARAAFPLLAVPVAAAAAVAVLAVGAGTEAPRAFAGWSATPTTANGNQVGRADARCLSYLMTQRVRQAAEASGRRGHGSPSQNLASSDWRSVLADTRGPYTMIVLEAKDGQAVATCFADRHSQASLGIGIGARPPVPVPAGRVALATSGSTTTPKR